MEPTLLDQPRALDGSIWGKVAAEKVPEKMRAQIRAGQSSVILLVAATEEPENLNLAPKRQSSGTVGAAALSITDVKHISASCILTFTAPALNLAESGGLIEY